MQMRQKLTYNASDPESGHMMMRSKGWYSLRMGLVNATFHCKCGYARLCIVPYPPQLLLRLRQPGSLLTSKNSLSSRRVLRCPLAETPQTTRATPRPATCRMSVRVEAASEPCPLRMPFTMTAPYFLLERRVGATTRGQVKFQGKEQKRGPSIFFAISPVCALTNS